MTSFKIMIKQFLMSFQSIVSFNFRENQTLFRLEKLLHGVEEFQNKTKKLKI